jgi:hypothetical protein
MFRTGAGNVSRSAGEAATPVTIAPGVLVPRPIAHQRAGGEGEPDRGRKTEEHRDAILRVQRLELKAAPRACQEHIDWPSSKGDRMRTTVTFDKFLTYDGTESVRRVLLSKRTVHRGIEDMQNHAGAQALRRSGAQALRRRSPSSWR